MPKATSLAAMSERMLEFLACPECSSDLALGGDTHAHVSSSHETLRCTGCNRHFPVVNSIPRFVDSDNYAANFGFQWSTFRRTQLDSFSGVPISRSRFLEQTGWTESDLRGKLVLDVGCGAGRFTEIALSLGARVVALDYSSAVDVCRANHELNEGLVVLQADVYKLPLKSEAFDYVYCFGVLQHTPDVEGAFKSLPRVLKPGGKMAIDVYPRLLRRVFDSHYWIRPITKRLRRDRLFKMVQRAVPILLPLSNVLGRVPIAGRWLRHAVPVANYEGRYPLSEQQLMDWAVLDTFDMLAPAHDKPQTRSTVMRWFQDGGFEAVKVFRRGQWIGRGIKRAS